MKEPSKSITRACSEEREKTLFPFSSHISFSKVHLYCCSHSDQIFFSTSGWDVIMQVLFSQTWPHQAAEDHHHTYSSPYFPGESTSSARQGTRQSRAAAVDLGRCHGDRGGGREDLYQKRVGLLCVCVCVCLCGGGCMHAHQGSSWVSHTPPHLLFSQSHEESTNQCLPKVWLMPAYAQSSHATFWFSTSRQIISAMSSSWYLHPSVCEVISTCKG